MDFLSRKFKKILAYSGLSISITLVIIWGVFSCSGGGVDKTIQNDTTNTGEEDNIVTVNTYDIPPQLENFDNSFKGILPNLGEIQINLRRYGGELSGNWWAWNNLKYRQIKGKIEADGETVHLIFYQENGDVLGNIDGNLKDKAIEGTWNDVNNTNGLPIILSLDNNQAIYKIKIEDLEVNKKSLDGKQTIKITYPVLVGIADIRMSKKINQIIEDYFENKTLVDSINQTKDSFNEDVKFEITFLANEFVSICKHHHLSKNNDTQLFDDSHGININFKRGKQYELRDLFNENAFEQLNTIIKTRINKSCGGSLTEEQLKACELRPSENTSFSLSKDKITFHLTERLPYKLRGCGYVKINYDDLATLFNPSGPLSEM
jgi:hypothetical protein